MSGFQLSAESCTCIPKAMGWWRAIPIAIVLYARIQHDLKALGNEQGFERAFLETLRSGWIVYYLI